MSEERMAVSKGEESPDAEFKTAIYGKIDEGEIRQQATDRMKQIAGGWYPTSDKIKQVTMTQLEELGEDVYGTVKIIDVKDHTQVEISE